MKWKTVTTYVDLATGEILIDKPINITIIKTKTYYERVSCSRGIARTTNWFRHNKFRQPELFTNSRTRKI